MNMFRRKLGSRDLWLLAETLAAVADSGTALPGALEALSRDAASPSLKRLCQDASAALQQGHSLHESLGAHAAALPSKFVALIEAGERTGQLGPALRQLADHYREASTVQGRIWLAMIYWIALTAVALAVLCMGLFIASGFTPLYEQMDIELPELTVVAIHLAEHWPVVLGVILSVLICPLVVLPFFAAMRPLRRMAEKTVLRMPILGPLLRARALRDLCQTTGMLLRSGHTAQTGLGHAAACSPSVVFADAIAGLGRVVDQGGLMSDGMEDRRLFPRHFVWLVSTAERRGDLPAAMATFATTLHRAAERQIALFIALLPSAYMFLIVVPMVSLLVIALLLPLIKLMGSLAM